MPIAGTGAGTVKIGLVKHADGGLTVERASAMLAACVHVDEAKGIRDIATAMAVYYRQQRASLQMQNDAAEIKLRAERRIGELAKQMPPVKPGPKRDPGNVAKNSKASVAEEEQIDRRDLTRWQKIADVPEKKFDAYIADAREHKTEITTAGALRVASPPKPRKTKPAAKPKSEPPPSNVIPFESPRPEPVAPVEDPEEWSSEDFKDAIGATIHAWFTTWRERGLRAGPLVSFIGATVSLEERLDEKARRIG